MKSRQFFHSLVAALALATLYQTPAVAGVSLGLQPVAQTVNLGDPVTVNVVISGLDTVSQIVSAFDLNVNYNSGILNATGVSFGSLLGDLGLFEADGDKVLSTPGVVDFWEVSYLLDADLAALQPDSFTLATLSFQTVGTGTSMLSFDSVTPPGVYITGTSAGRLVLDSVGTGSITVQRANSIPVPATLWLVLLGLCTLTGRRLRVS